jgi:hypothetical protein
LPVSGWTNIFSSSLLSPNRESKNVDSAEKEARKALNRLRRALEKGVRELDTLEGAIRHAEGDDFPMAEYESVRNRLSTVMDFLEEEGQRLEAKILETGGLEPGRIRRSSS